MERTEKVNGEYIRSVMLFIHFGTDMFFQIEVFTNNGLVFDTQNVTLSNMRGATVTGSTDEDNITLMNSSNCTVDISNANNNIFVSDNVRVVNGQGNKVKAGDHDQVTFGTHNYETNTDTTKANHEGEGTYRQ